MATILPDRSTMESSDIATIKLPGLIKKDRHIHIPTKMMPTSLISLGVLCDDRYTITLDKKDMSVQKNGKEIIKGTRNMKT